MTSLPSPISSLSLLLNRRVFLRRLAATALMSGAGWPRLLAASMGGDTLDGENARAMRPGWSSRPRRYAPEDAAFVIRNGTERFNRPLYGAYVSAEAPVNAGARMDVADGFRVDAGDLPELSLYLPGQGGVLAWGVSRGGSSKWLSEMASVTMRYGGGRVRYEIRDDALLGRGVLQVEVQTAVAGLQVMVRSEGIANDTELFWAFGGASGERPASNGDVGCETVPVSALFAFRSENCANNSYKLEKTAAVLHSPAGRLRLSFPEGATLHVAAAEAWAEGWVALAKPAGKEEKLPVLAGSMPLATQAELYFVVQLLGASEAGSAPAADGTAAVRESFAARRRQLAAVAGAVAMETPDAYLSPVVAALLTAVDGLWNANEQCMMAGGVAERAAAPGWRGPYALDAMGRHDRMRAHLRYWLAKQNQEAFPPGFNGDEEMRAAADAGSHLTRKESLLHTNGDLGGGHQDRNLVFFDALVRHLRWTGDAGFAREVWPALLRHMDWQYRLFRRVFPHPDHDAPREMQALPLYESYAAVPSSENLGYNGGGVAHATAYNYFLNRATASVARLLNEDPVPFDEEAALTREAMRRLLWVQARGCFAEAKDLAYPQTVFVNPALWTISRTLDAELPTPREAWQMCAERLAAMRRIPVEGNDVPAGGYLLASSSWTVAEPALNRISMAEDMHFALALWQAGLADEAYALLRGNLLDSMYQGVCPGNFHVTSQLDPHAGETQRDAGDAIGITARALVEGLFGVLPDMMRGTLTIRPGFPAEWNGARLSHPEIDVAWRRDGMHETFAITSRLPKPVALTLLLPARSTADPVVLSNGQAYPFAFDPNATGTPRLVLTNFPPATAWQIDVRWRGRPPIVTPARATYRVGERIALPVPLVAAQIDDPQGCLSGDVANAVGNHAVFVHVVEEKCGYWLPIPLEIVPREATNAAMVMAERYEPVDLSKLFKSNVTELLARSYVAPRSAFCSLAVPEHLLGGWSRDDVRFEIDDAGLRGAGGMLKTVFGIPFVTPADRAVANCRFLSFWEQDTQGVTVSLTGKAHTVYLLMTGTTFPLATGTEHGAVTVGYADGTISRLSLRAPETWWPVEQDYVTDGVLFSLDAARPLPPRVDLRSGKTRLLEHAGYKGGPVPGGAATVLHLPLHADRELASVRVECGVYGIAMALLGITLGR